MNIAGTFCTVANRLEVSFSKSASALVDGASFGINAVGRASGVGGAARISPRFGAVAPATGGGGGGGATGIGKRPASVNGVGAAFGGGATIGTAAGLGASIASAFGAGCGAGASFTGSNAGGGGGGCTPSAGLGESNVVDFRRKNGKILPSSSSSLSQRVI
jgi:hypothetical protein